MTSSDNGTLSLEEAAEILAIGGGPRYGNLFTLRRNAQMGRLATWTDPHTDVLVTTRENLEDFREMWLQPESDALSNIAEIERQSHDPAPDIEAWMAAHGDARHGRAVAQRRREKRQKRPASTLKRLTPTQFAKAWREGGYGPPPDLD